MKKKSRLRVSISLLTIAAGFSLLALVEFGSANPSHGGQPNNRLGAGTFAQVTADGIIIENLAGDDGQSVATALRRHADVSSNGVAPRHSEAATAFAPKRSFLQPLGNTLWVVDDENAIADGVAIDSNDVWGAWTLQGARLSAYPIAGDGTPDFEFSSFGEAVPVWRPPRAPIAWPTWNRMPLETISGSMALGPPVTVYRTGPFRFRSATRICQPVRGRSPCLMMAPRLQLLLAIR